VPATAAIEHFIIGAAAARMCGRLRIPHTDDLLIKTTDIHQRGEKIPAPYTRRGPTHTIAAFFPLFFLLFRHWHTQQKIKSCSSAAGGRFCQFHLGSEHLFRKLVCALLSNVGFCQCARERERENVAIRPGWLAKKLGPKILREREKLTHPYSL
jgi:hypothetical protein